MIQDAKHTVSTHTQNHTIQVINGYLTIEGEQRTLTPEETEQLPRCPAHLAVWPGSDAG